MKNVITAVFLILAANAASAAGFSPWTDARAIPEPIETRYVSVEATGFGPWRDGKVADVRDAVTSAGVAVTDREPNVFRPWS